jgi:1,4-dihydroxy-2-naphthoyl-CoA hydrolase
VWAGRLIHTEFNRCLKSTTYLKELIMAIWKTAIHIDDINNRGKNTMSEFLNMEFIEVGDEYLLAKMPVNARTKQPIGIMHGGASCALAETVGSTAGNYCVDQEFYYCVGLDINTNHIRSIRSGDVFAKATPFHLGKSTQVWHIEIRDEASNMISVNRLTLAVLKR